MPFANIIGAMGNKYEMGMLFLAYQPSRCNAVGFGSLTLYYRAYGIEEGLN